MLIICPPEVLEVIARRAAEIVLADIAPNPGCWLTGAKAAAVYLGCSPKRVYNRLHEIPHVKEGCRLKFHTAALDEWLERLAQ
jgi:excisionase family DNA binding protein